MNLLESFKNYLFSQKPEPSKATVKNYTADIRHFIEWFENTYHVVFQSSLITAQHWKQFKTYKQKDLSPASLERHLSSLRKFFQYLLATKAIQENPFDIEVIKVEHEEKDPWLLKEFKETLRKEQVSKLTIKNYASDIQQFLSWIDANKKTGIENGRVILPFLNQYFLEQYKHHLQNEAHFSPSSIKRKVSSIKKYITWITHEAGVIEKDTIANEATFLEQKGITQINQSVVQKLQVTKEDFSPLLQTVEVEASKTTLQSTERNTPVNSNTSYSLPNEIDNITETTKNIKPHTDTVITDRIPEEETGKSFAFLNPAFEKNYYKDKLNNDNKQKNERSAKKRRYSKIPPLRLFQKIFRGLNLLIDMTMVLPIAKSLEKTDYFIWVAKGRPVFSKKLFVMPVMPKIEIEPSESIKDFYVASKEQLHSAKKKLKKKLLGIVIPEQIQHLLKHRPRWYHKYHSYPLAHYFHFAILVIFMSAVGFNLYNSFFGNGNAKPVFASLPTAPPKILSFQGKLTDKNNNPITTRTNVRFAAYNSSMASGSALLWQEVDNVQPDKNGNVSVALGNTSYLDPAIFSKDQGLWLGVTVEQADELRPRQQLATTTYAANAETLQGLAPITNPDAGTKNVVLALNSTGDLTINDNNDHTFRATGGQFILSGNTTVIGTNPGSSGDVQLAPDGLGQVDIQKPIQNTSNYNNIPSAVGSVEVDDTFAILATSSGQSAFTLNQNGYGPLFSASSSGVAKFTIDNDGSITSAGDLSIKGLVKSNLTPFGNNLNLGSNVSQWNNLFVKSIYLDGTPLTQTWQESADSIFPINQSKNFLIGLTASTSANFEVVASTGAVLTQSDITLTGTSSAIGTVNNQTLQLGNETTGAISLRPNNATGLFVNGSGSVGIGTETIANNLSLFVQHDTNSGSFGVDQSANTRINQAGLCVSSDNSCATKNISSGTIYATTTTIANADYAENYISSQQLEPGDIVMPAADGNNAAVVKSTNQYQSQMTGVVSTAPGIVLNSDAQTDGSHPNKYPIALSGRVPVKVSIANGVIRTGDLLTSSSTPGVAMKATEAGPIIGKALEDFSDATPGKIMAYISVSFGNPSVSLADSGNLNIVDQLASNLNTDQKNILQNFLTEIATGAQTTIESLYANVISAKTIISERVIAEGSLIAPTANINEVHSNLLSPLSEKGKIALTLEDNRIQIHSDNTASSAAVTSFDNQGNATFSGQVNTNGLNVTTDATISGTLHAGKILASDIEGLPTATTGAQYITNVTNVYNATSSATKESNGSQVSKDYAVGSSDSFDPSHPLVNIASYSAQFADVASLHLNTATIEQGLVSLGPTSLSDTSITGQLSIGSQFVFADNSINVLGGDLELQPLKQGGVAIAGRQVYIDSNGNITANGNATFNGMIAANTITPIKDHDLTVKLDNGNTNEKAANFKITNASNSAIFNVNQIGDIISSGAATINKLNFTITKPALALSDNELIASGSAGVATISAKQTYVQIDNSLVTPKSLIYITPVGSIGQAPFLLRQVPGQSFSVGIDQPALKNTTFNWLIIN